MGIHNDRASHTHQHETKQNVYEMSRLRVRTKERKINERKLQRFNVQFKS